MVGGNDYVIQVKGNQPKLKEAITEYADTHEINDKYREKQKNKGREENREIKIFRKVKGGVFDNWVGLKELIVVHRWGIRGKKTYDEISYYISSRKNTCAKSYAKGIRGHWGIENNLHWVKDVMLVCRICRNSQKQMGICIEYRY